ncbi:multidrug efflux system membrane fusion protein [Pseudomonas nitritireducens]|uniref:Multidrug efflux system membrane fusion protein n=1 Tax=Pseudomonas nitroreducens TaxID=46680 RepID=A0A7W7KSN3_PSENT|nr:efflux RND transporter periplasmic adaptor subunit [Pseudomonas nitritireducens]MBB4868227.1 multidrug efflux system membrane fusion protein [Pseudomonas nitritireducens]
MYTSTSAFKYTMSFIAVGMLAACGQSEKNTVSAQPPPVVSVAQVLVQSINDRDDFTGRLEAPESVELRPRVSGHIDSVLFRDGALVKKGDLLFQIDPRPFQAEVNRLGAQLEQARANRARAAREAQRGERLRASNAISDELADARKTAHQEALSAVAAIQAQLDAARLNLSFTRVTAPIDGAISRAEVTAGNLVNAGATLLTTLVGTRQLYAYFDIDEATYLKLAQQMRKRTSTERTRVPVRLALSTDEHPNYEGYLDFLDNQVNPRTGTLRARAVIDNTQWELTPGLYVRLQLPAGDAYAATLVRDEAIGTDLGNRFVLILGEDGVVNYRAVKLGPRIEGLRVIRTGLQAGDHIVVNGLQRTRPGTKVSPQQVAMVGNDVLARLAGQISNNAEGSLTNAANDSPSVSSAPRG